MIDHDPADLGQVLTQIVEQAACGRGRHTQQHKDDAEAQDERQPVRERDESA